MNQMEVYETNEFTVVIDNKGSKGWLKRKLYLKAIRENNIPEVQRLLRLGVPVDFLGLDQGRTPLHYAIENGQLEIVKELLKHDANVNATDTKDFTPLQIAATKNNQETIELLINKGANFSNGQSPIGFALNFRQFQNVILLMKYGAQLDTLFHKILRDGKDENGLTVLHWAVMDGDIDIVKSLLEHNADIDSTIGIHCNFECHIEGEPVRSFKEMTALHLATVLGNAATVNLLLLYGAEIEVSDRDLETPLNLAMHVGEITLKLNNGLQIKRQIDMESNEIIVSRLLPNSYKESKDISKMTPLLRATSKGLVTSVTQLIHRDANLEATDQDKNTALHIASSMGNSEIVTILLGKGAEINSINSRNETPLILAIQNRQQEIVNKLMDKGAKIDVFNFMPKSNQGNDQCSLCFNPKNGIFAFQPCGHANACKSCCVKLTFLEDRDLKKCPICRTNVTHFQKIYL